MPWPKTLKFWFAVLISLTLVPIGGVLGQDLPGSGWWSGEQVQNVGSAAATITIVAYDTASSATYVATSPTSIAPGASITFLPSNFSGMPAGFSGSAILSSDQPMKAIANITNQLTGGLGIAGGKAAAQYQGTESAATTLYFPLVKNNRYGSTTAFYLQNVGTSSSTAAATFRMDNGSTYNYTTPAISPNQRLVVLPDDAGVPSNPSDGTRVNIGSLTITSAQPLAGTVLEFKVGEEIATVLKGSRAFTPAQVDSKAFAPVVKNSRFNRFTGIQVLNVAGSPIDVSITYVGSANVPGCKDVTFVDSATGVAAGTSRTFVQLPGKTNLVSNCTAAATIEATGSFVAIVNEDNSAGGTAAGIMYSAIPSNSVTTKVSAPLFKDQRYGFSTGLQIQNVGPGTATNVVATFQCKGNNGANVPFTAISNAQSITSGGAFLFLRPSSMPPGTFTPGNPFSMSGANCGVTITSDQPIVAILNESPDTPGALDDNNYEGFNLSP